MINSLFIVVMDAQNTKINVKKKMLSRICIVQIKPKLLIHQFSVKMWLQNIVWNMKNSQNIPEGTHCTFFFHSNLDISYLI